MRLVSDSQEKTIRTLGERVTAQIDKMGLSELEKGNYVLVVDIPEATYLATNESDAGGVLLTMKKAEISLMSSVFEEDEQK